MAYAEWDDSLSTGNEEIDAQHKWLFRVLNLLVESIGGEGEEQASIRCLVDMERYALTHFAAEEAYMERIGYPGLAGHKLLHLGFAEQVEGFREGLITGEILAMDVAAFLKNWLVQHIKVADHAIVPGSGAGA